MFLTLFLSSLPPLFLISYCYFSLHFPILVFLFVCLAQREEQREVFGENNLEGADHDIKKTDDAGAAAPPAASAAAGKFGGGATGFSTTAQAISDAALSAYRESYTER